MSEVTPQGARKRVLVSIAVVAAVFLGVKLPSLRFAEIENDELVYVSVAANLKLHERYTLQGAQVLERLSADVYDRPLFHHPPLAIWLMEKTLRPGWPPRAPVLVSWLGHALLLAGVALWLRALMPDDFSRLAPWVLLAAALDPLAVLTGQRIWLDALAAGLVAVGSGLYLNAQRQSSRGRETLWLLGSGLTLGLAMLAKLPSALAFPALAAAFALRRGDRGARAAVRHLAWVVLPAAAVVAPWFVAFWRQYGTLLPNWIEPDAWMLEAHPFVRRMRERPPYYFFLQTAAVYPWLAFTAWSAWRSGRQRSSYRLPALFVLWILVAVSGLSIAGHGYQMRYLGACGAPLYALFALTLRDLRRDAGRLVPWMVACAGAGGVLGLLHVVRHTWFDVRSWFQVFG